MSPRLSAIVILAAMALASEQHEPLTESVTHSGLVEVDTMVPEESPKASLNQIPESSASNSNSGVESSPASPSSMVELDEMFKAFGDLGHESSTPSTPEELQQAADEARQADAEPTDDKHIAVDWSTQELASEMTTISSELVGGPTLLSAVKTWCGPSTELLLRVEDKMNVEGVNKAKCVVHLALH